MNFSTLFTIYSPSVNVPAFPVTYNSCLAWLSIPMHDMYFRRLLCILLFPLFPAILTTSAFKDGALSFLLHCLVYSGSDFCTLQRSQGISSARFLVVCFLPILPNVLWKGGGFPILFFCVPFAATSSNLLLLSSGKRSPLCLLRTPRMGRIFNRCRTTYLYSIPLPGGVLKEQ